MYTSIEAGSVVILVFTNIALNNTVTFGKYSSIKTI